MIYLHKVLPVLLSPIFVFSVLVMIGTWRKRRTLCYVALAGLWLLATPVASDSLFRFIEEYSVKKSITKIPSADAIVVLSGMLSDSPGEDGLEQEWGDPDRFFAGLQLYKAGKSKRLIFTRGRMPWAVVKESEGDILRRAAMESGIPSRSISLTEEVANTKEEAAAVRKIMGDSPSQVILVTSAFHMPRAKTVFEREGMGVVTYPVDFKVSVKQITVMDFLPDARALYLSDIAIRELIGRAYYKFVSIS